MVRGLPAGFTFFVGFTAVWLLFCLVFVAAITLSAGTRADLQRIEWLVSGPYR